MRGMCVPLWAGSVCLGLALSGCAGTPEPRPEPPRLALVVRHYVGSPLTGPKPASARGTELSPEPSSALAVSCEFLYLERMPEDVLEPLSATARLVFVADSAEPFRAATSLVAGARIGVTSAFEELVTAAEEKLGGRVRELGSVSCALPAGTTSVFEARSLAARAGAVGVAVPTAVDLHVGRGAHPERDRLTVVLSVESLVMTQADPTLLAEEQRDAKLVPVAAHESLVLDRSPEIDGAPLGVVFFSPFDAKRGPAVAAILRVSTAPRSGPARAAHVRAVARCMSDLRQSVDTVAVESVPVTASELTDAKLESARAALRSKEHRRPALTLIANATNARLAADLALIADEDTLEHYFVELFARSPAEITGGTTKPDSSRLGWLLELGAYRLLLGRLVNEQLSPDLSSILLRHGGAVAALGDELDEALARSKDLAGFEKYLVDQNRAFLDHRHPATRARAFDWLELRGLAPAGYDPLAPVAERKAALERDRAARRRR